MLGPSRAISDHPVPLAVLLRSLKTAQGRPKTDPRPLKIAPRPVQDRSRASNFYSPRPQGADQHLGISLGRVPFFPSIPRGNWPLNKYLADQEHAWPPKSSLGPSSAARCASPKPQDRPRSTQDRSKTAQDRPKTGPRPLKSLQLLLPQASGSRSAPWNLPCTTSAEQPSGLKNQKYAGDFLSDDRGYLSPVM